MSNKIGMSNEHKSTSETIYSRKRGSLDGGDWASLKHHQYEYFPFAINISSAFRASSLSSPGLVYK